MASILPTSSTADKTACSRSMGHHELQRSPRRRQRPRPALDLGEFRRADAGSVRVSCYSRTRGVLIGIRTNPKPLTMSAGPAESLLQASASASGLVNAQQIDYCLRVARHRQSQQGMPADSPVSDRLLAEILVEQAVLTNYQVDQLLAGRTKLNLGPYIITDWIGQGGMGQVFKAVHQVMGREVAVKVLPLTRATPASMESFNREIRMQAALDCPYLVRAYDAGQDGRVHFLVTEYVPGMDLRKLVKSRGALPMQQAARIVMQAALGLDYAHSKGLVHRDVKPGNILVMPSGDAKVSDVGLAGFAHDLINDPRAGKIVGTTDYLSPEQIRTPLDIKPTSDIYSLGCTLYYSVCGKVPFPGGDSASKLRRHLDETPWHPRRFAPDISEDFVDIIADMMEKDPGKRIATAAEVAARLEPWANDSYAMGAISMGRSPWMAPPPPSHEEERSSDGSANVARQTLTKGGARTELPQPPWTQETSYDEWTPQASARDSTDASSSVAAPQLFPATETIVPEKLAPENINLQPPRMNTGLIIALTIAIVLPPAMLLGAILGYLVAR
jgi:eukaryotic-like serine/threonine-protein kinase